MSFSNKVRVIIYRFKERGLEVFLVNNQEEDIWEIPQGSGSKEGTRQLFMDDELIELDPVQQDNGASEEALAVEGEWHDIPSLKNMLSEDARLLKNKIKEMEKGSFLNVKDAFKKVLPQQYAFLKELKDILNDRNSLKNL